MIGSLMCVRPGLVGIVIQRAEEVMHAVAKSSKPIDLHAFGGMRSQDVHWGITQHIEAII